jgi:hypothetical protein
MVRLVIQSGNAEWRYVCSELGTVPLLRFSKPHSPDHRLALQTRSSRATVVLMHRPGSFGAGLLAILLLAVAQPASARSSTRECPAVQVQGGVVRVFPSDIVVQNPRAYGTNTAFFVTIRTGRCSGALSVLVDVLGAADEKKALGSRGFRVRRVARGRLRGRPYHLVTAKRGGTLLRYTRFGRRLRRP